MRLGLILIVLVSSVFASEAGHGHHEAHVSELLWPIVNFVLFFSFIIFKARKPIKEGFDKNADLIKELFEYAKAKDEDASKKIATYKQKMEEFHLEVDRLKKEMDEEFVSFEKETLEETKRQIERSNLDAKRKVQSEKNKKLNELNEELLDKIILKTKDTFGTNSSLRDKATNKIIAAL